MLLDTQRQAMGDHCPPSTRRLQAWTGWAQELGLTSGAAAGAIQPVPVQFQFSFSFSAVFRSFGDHVGSFRCHFAVF